MQCLDFHNEWQLINLTGLIASKWRHGNLHQQTNELHQMFTWNAKLVLEVSGLLEHLDTMVVGVGHNYVLVHAKAEAMRWIELALSRTKLTKLAPINNYTSIDELKNMWRWLNTNVFLVIHFLPTNWMKCTTLQENLESATFNVFRSSIYIWKPDSLRSCTVIRCLSNGA